MDCSYQLKDAYDFLIKITPIVISLCVLLVALHQSKISKEKVRLDLYNRRFDIYSRTLGFFQALLSYDASKPKDNFLLLHNDFVKSYKESQFLFDKDSGIYELLTEMHKKSFKITGFEAISQELARAGAQDELIRGFQESQDAWNWIGEGISKLEKSMGPYLNFHKIAV